MTTLAELAEAMLTEMESAGSVRQYQIGNRMVMRHGILEQVEAYLKLQQLANESTRMCQLGRVLPRT